MQNSSVQITIVLTLTSIFMLLIYTVILKYHFLNGISLGIEMYVQGILLLLFMIYMLIKLYKL